MPRHTAQSFWMTRDKPWSDIDFLVAIIDNPSTAQEATWIGTGKKLQPEITKDNKIPGSAVLIRKTKTATH